MKLKLVLSPELEAKRLGQSHRPVSRTNQALGTAGHITSVYLSEGTKTKLNQMALSMQRSISSVAAELIEAALEQLVTSEPDDSASIQTPRTLTPDEVRAEAEDNEAIRRGQNPRDDADIANATNARIRKTLRAAGVPDPHAVITPKPTREDFEWRRANPQTGEWYSDYDPVKRAWKR